MSHPIHLPHRRSFLVGLVIALSIGLACKSSESAKTNANFIPETIDVQSCAACGMVVAEQPAPRAQLFHRNGKAVHLCSIGDLLHYLDAPHPEGEAQAIFVEALDADSGLQGNSGPHPFVAADSAWFVRGVKRQHVMGEPVLSYTTRSLAEKAASEHQGKLVDWTGLRTKKDNH
jgi:nitrous oxide reductase accessory protein NosL